MSDIYIHSEMESVTSARCLNVVVICRLLYQHTLCFDKDFVYLD